MIFHAKLLRICKIGSPEGVRGASFTRSLWKEHSKITSHVDRV
jgi:hypothetical protein